MDMLFKLRVSLISRAHSAPVLLIIVAVYQIWQRVDSNSPGPFSPFVHVNARGGHSDFFSGQLVDFFVADLCCSEARFWLMRISVHGSMQVLFNVSAGT